MVNIFTAAVYNLLKIKLRTNWKYKIKIQPRLQRTLRCTSQI